MSVKIAIRTGNIFYDQNKLELGVKQYKSNQLKSSDIGEI